MNVYPISSSQLYDDLADDITEWSQAIDDIHQQFGEQGVKEILRSLQNHVLDKGITLSEATLNTPYINTIHATDQGSYPGDIQLEKKIENIIRWNAMAMVLQAQDQGTGVGGHIATYASAATTLEVGFQHFFRGRTADYGGDILLPQPHAAPRYLCPGVFGGAFKRAGAF